MGSAWATPQTIKVNMTQAQAPGTYFINLKLFFNFFIPQVTGCSLVEKH